MTKPILCLDFDGVLHSYTSGWKGAAVVPDPPTDGAMRFIWDAADHFRIAVFSSRSNQPGGLHAMQAWLTEHFRFFWAADRTRCDDILAEIEWPLEKPPAMVTIDDRALTFDGTWPSIEDLKAFQPWNKKPKGETARALLAGPSSEIERLRSGWLDQASRDSTEIVRLEVEIERLRASRDELLAAGEAMMKVRYNPNRTPAQAEDAAILMRAAISRAKGETK